MHPMSICEFDNNNILSLMLYRLQFRMFQCMGRPWQMVAGDILEVYYPFKVIAIS